MTPEKTVSARTLQERAFIERLYAAATGYCRQVGRVPCFYDGSHIQCHHEKKCIIIEAKKTDPDESPGIQCIAVHPRTVYVFIVTPETLSAYERAFASGQVLRLPEFKTRRKRVHASGLNTLAAKLEEASELESQYVSDREPTDGSPIRS